MGCWYGSCQVTGLSIFPGDRIVMIPILLNRGEYNPVMRPVRGEYNDYGSICKIDPNPFFDKYFERALTIMERTSDEVEDQYGREIPVEPSDKCKVWLGPESDHSLDHEGLPKDVEEFFNLMERQSCRGNVISVRGESIYDDKWMPLEACMVLESVYDWMVQKVELNRWLKESFDEAINAIEPFKDAVIDEDDSFSFRENFRFMDKFNELCNCGESRRINSGIRIYHNFINMDSSEIKALFLNLVEYRKFIECFDQLRRVFTPPAQAGSQDENHDIILDLNKVIETHISETKKKFEEY